MKELLEESNCKAVKSYADITASSQTEVILIEELSAVQTTKEVVHQVHWELGVEKTEKAPKNTLNRPYLSS